MEVGVRELRAHLSRYLKRVEAGEEILVTDRGKPVARTPADGRSKLEELIAAGIVEPAPKPWRGPLPRPVKTEGTVSDLVKSSGADRVFRDLGLREALRRGAGLGGGAAAVGRLYAGRLLAAALPGGARGARRSPTDRKDGEGRAPARPSAARGALGGGRPSRRADVPRPPSRRSGRSARALRLRRRAPRVLETLASDETLLVTFDEDLRRAARAIGFAVAPAG
jgi:prevent-host-death family protein